MKTPNWQRVLDLLSDGKPHLSSEFRDKLGLLEYRKRLSELRDKGHEVVSITITDEKGFKRPGYQLVTPMLRGDLFLEHIGAM